MNGTISLETFLDERKFSNCLYFLQVYLQSKISWYTAIKVICFSGEIVQIILKPGYFFNVSLTILAVWISCNLPAKIKICSSSICQGHYQWLPNPSNLDGCYSKFTSKFKSWFFRPPELQNQYHEYSENAPAVVFAEKGGHVHFSRQSMSV